MVISFIIPAHDEEKLLPATLAAIHQAAKELRLEYEIIVADDASTDGTAQAARDGGARVVSISRRQISAARNAGVGEATGDRFIFVDADTLVTTPAVREALAALDGGAVGGGSSVAFDGQIPGYAKVLLPVCLLLLRMGKCCGGCFFFCTRDALAHVGGWSEEVFASEEVILARAMGKIGRFVIIREKVVTSGRKLRAFSGWELIGLLLRAAWSPRKLVRDRSRLDLWYGPRRRDVGRG